MSFLLTDRKVGKEDVIGLAEFWVDPKNKGYGRKALMMIEGIADTKIVVGFADPIVAGFYAKCNWFIGPMIDGKYIVASEPINVSDFTGEIW